MIIREKNRWTSVTVGLVMRGRIEYMLTHCLTLVCACTHKKTPHRHTHTHTHSCILSTFDSSSAILFSRYVTCLIRVG